MKYRSRKPKPATGMDMSVTLSLPATASASLNAAALVKFMGIVSDAANAVGAVWVHVHCAGIPDELEDALQAAFDKVNKQPDIRLVVDNGPRD